jgi:ubiquinone/menaquinone biosynthesis C-methylase UbiE
MIDVARRRQMAFHGANAEALPFEDKTFDAVRFRECSHPTFERAVRSLEL